MSTPAPETPQRPRIPFHRGWVAPSAAPPVALTREIRRPERLPVLPPKKGHPVLLFLAAAGIGGLAILGATYLGPIALNAGARVTVAQTQLTSADDACGDNGVQMGGFSTPVGTSISLNFTLPDNASAGSCTISWLVADTPGFKVVSAQLPVPVPEGGSGSLLFVLKVPGSGYNGDLALDIE